MATQLGMTSAQKERQKVDALAQDILDKMNEVRGRKNMSKIEFAEFIGVSPDRYHKWLAGKVGNANFSSLVTAALRCGIKLEVSRD